MTPTFHSYWLGLSREQREELAKRARTTVGYLEKLAGGFGLPSLTKAAQIVRSTPGLGVEAPLPIECFLPRYEARRQL